MDITPPPRQLLSIDEVCASLAGLSRAQVYRLVRTGKLSAVKIGTRTFVTVPELDRYVASLEASKQIGQQDRMTELRGVIRAKGEAKTTDSR